MTLGHVETLHTVHPARIGAIELDLKYRLPQRAVKANPRRRKPFVIENIVETFAIDTFRDRRITQKLLYLSNYLRCMG